MKFKKLGKQFRENYDLDPSDPNKKFWDCVKIRFVHVDPEKSNFEKKIEKIEGLAKPSIFSIFFSKLDFSGST